MNFLLEGEETSRILFRKILISDFSDWLPFHQDPTTSIHWKSPLENAHTACEKWYRKQFYRYENNLGGMNALIEKETGQLIGHCGLLKQIVDGTEELEISYSLLPKYWSKGFASEAAKKCKDYAFANKQAESLISIISLTNLPSEKVALKNGMKVEKQTVYKNNKVNIFRIYRSDWIDHNNIKNIS